LFPADQFKPQNTVAICVPARDMVHTSFAFDLASAVGHHACTSDDNIMTKVSQGTLLVDQRNSLVEEALEEGATHILWIDSDMRFPKDVIQQMLDRDLDIVAANCSRRKHPAAFIALNADDERGIYTVETTPDSTGVEEIIAVGFGVMMVRAQVFRDMPKPWHKLIWNSRDEKFVGEDMAWCHGARDAGYAIHIDHDLSKHIYHTGMHEFGCEDIWNGADNVCGVAG
jgi:hypothetical protein